MAAPRMTMLTPTRLLLSSNTRINRGTCIRFNSTSSSPTPSAPRPTPAPSNAEQDQSSVLATYNGPMTNIFGRLKLFSLTSLSLSTCATPLLLFGGGDNIPMITRLGLVAAAMSTSGASTGMVAWIAKPYVAQMNLVKGKPSSSSSPSSPSTTSPTDAPKPVLEMRTTSWRLRPLQTTIYEPSFIRPTERPFATWELPVSLPSLPAQYEAEFAAKGSVTRLLAETKDLKTGKMTGRYWALWKREEADAAKNSAEATGQCIQEGQVVRHFNVQEDLLGEDWRVL